MSSAGSHVLISGSKFSLKRDSFFLSLENSAPYWRHLKFIIFFTEQLFFARRRLRAFEDLCAARGRSNA